MKRLMVVSLGLSLLGCAAAAYQQKIQTTMDGYLGSHYAELQDQIGPPTRVSQMMGVAGRFFPGQRNGK